MPTVTYIYLKNAYPLASLRGIHVLYAFLTPLRENKCA